MAKIGSWNMAEMKGVNLPQKAQSAFTSVTESLVGAKYEPVLYVGKQIVNGMNYCILASQQILVPNAELRLVKMIIHVSLEGTASIVSISGIEL